MNVIQNLTTYKLSQFIRIPKLPCIIENVQYPLEKPTDKSNNQNSYSYSYSYNKNDNLLINVIQTSPQNTNFKDNLIWSNISSPDDLIIIFDIMGNPQQLNHNRFPNCNLKILRSIDFITLSNVTKYLKQLHIHLLDGTLKDFLQLTSETIIKGIIIDNISYCSYDNNSLQFSELVTQARQLQDCLGCWFLSISFGMNFYRYRSNANKINTNVNLKYPTLLPHSYLQQMKYNILQERDGHLKNLTI